ncbi:MAG: polyketide synthase dehydratase domain-containing protein, partial [Cyanobacteria bacterium J06600_6]
MSEATTEIQFILNVGDKGSSSNFEIFSLDNDSDWTINSQGKINKSFLDIKDSNLTQYKQEINYKVDVDKYYQDLSKRGLEYGESLRAIAKLYSADNRALGKVELPASLVSDAANYIIHPVLLDACLQVSGAAIDDDSDRMYLPIAIEKIVFSTNHSSLKTAWSYAKLIDYNAGIYTLDFELISERQETIAVITGVKIKSTQVNLLNRQNSNIDDWLYQVEWRDASINSKLDNSFISLLDIQHGAKQKFAQLINNSNFNNYLQLLAELEEISVHYIVNALIKLGVDFEVGQLLSPSVEQFSILEEHESLWSRLLDILTEAGILESAHDIWQVIKVPDLVNINKQQQQLLNQYPQAQAELDLLHRCASQLDKVLNGDVDPKELLFPGGDLGITTSLYQDSPGAKVTNTLVAETIQQALSNQPQGKTIKILEIGAGTGGTTAYILPKLNPSNTEYTFSDLSPLFLTKAREKFKQYDFVKYELLDISKTSQAPKTYDIIIAANVLHATADLKHTLSNVRQLLNPQGLLIIVEGTQPARWFDLTFGMTEGWWKFVDKQLRANYPLISVYNWQKLLLDADFTVGTSPKTPLQQAVIIAQASNKAIARQHYLIFADKQGIGTELANYLAQSDRNYTLVTSGTEFKQESANKYQINALGPSSCDRLIKHLQQKEIKPDCIIYLQSLDRDRNNLKSN